MADWRKHMLVACESYSEAMLVLSVFSVWKKALDGEIEFSGDDILKEILDRSKLKKDPFSIMEYKDKLKGGEIRERYAILYGFDPKKYSS